MLRIVHESGGQEVGVAQVGLDELCRSAAQEMLAVALEAERQAYLERHAGVVDTSGRRATLVPAVEHRHALKHRVEIEVGSGSPDLSCSGR